MIQVYIRGRLGNQLFQYACAKHYSKKWNEEMCVKFGEDKNQLDNFKIKNLKIVEKYNINFFQKIILIIFLVIRRIYSNNKPIRQQKIEFKFQKILNKTGIYWYINGYYDFSYSKAKNKIFIGYFESEKYFEDIIEEIKNEYKIKKELKNNEMIKKMKETNSVCISIRRGDFVSIRNIVCNEKYYENAISEISKYVKNPTFFVFSDDIKWVKKNMKFPGETYYESGKDLPYETLTIMSNCKNFIISNSTFHWWAQYLSPYENKVVIAPKMWRNYEIKLDIMQDNWILIDNESNL